MQVDMMVDFKTLLWVFLLLISSCNGQNEKYCSITPDHTMCKPPGLAAACGSDVPIKSVTEAEKAQIVREHNEFRARVANGEEHLGAPGPHPRASNMMEMTWDDELAAIAQKHADQCVFEHDCSDCRHVERFGVGQNIFASFQGAETPKVVWHEAIQTWYDEVALHPSAEVDDYKFSHETGHYTAMVWSDTNKVGCGITMYKEGQWYRKLYVCNYGPSGNIVHAHIYEKGEPCSLCPDGATCSKNYPGLCIGGDDVSSKPPAAEEAEEEPSTNEEAPADPLQDLGAEDAQLSNDIDQQSFGNENGQGNFGNQGRPGGRNPGRPNQGSGNRNRPGQGSSGNRNRPNQGASGNRNRPNQASGNQNRPNQGGSGNRNRPNQGSSGNRNRPSGNRNRPGSSNNNRPGNNNNRAGPNRNRPNANTNRPNANRNRPNNNQSGGSRNRPGGNRNRPNANRITNNDRNKQNDRNSIPKTIQNNAQSIQSNQVGGGSTPMIIFEPGSAASQSTSQNVIRTNSLENVKEILRSLPPGSKPIVFLRSSRGTMRRMNVSVPRGQGKSLSASRKVRSTKTPTMLQHLDLQPTEVSGSSPSQSNGMLGPILKSLAKTSNAEAVSKEMLLSCQDETLPCPVVALSGTWNHGTESESNVIRSVLSPGEGGQIVLGQAISAPTTQAACVTLSYKFERTASEQLPRVQVSVWPLGQVLLQEDLDEVSTVLEDGWSNTKVSFAPIRNPFMVVLTVHQNQGSEDLPIALRGFMITEGLCS